MFTNQIRFFDYSEAKYFKIDKKKFARKIFKTKNLNYIGVKKFFRYGTKFGYNVKINNKYKKNLAYYINKTNLKKKIKKIKIKKKYLCNAN